MNYLGKRKIREGLVISDKMDKTVVVAVETRKVHPLYKKAIKVSKKYKAHDENNDCKVGDKVKIIETRPLSKEKRWRVTEIISKREMVETGPEQKE
ncbi:MAG: 30S ribosomal protein S17 [Dehalococcoidia bacterium]